jgi:hypothetical protein
VGEDGVTSVRRIAIVALMVATSPACSRTSPQTVVSQVPTPTPHASSTPSSPKLIPNGNYLLQPGDYFTNFEPRITLTLRRTWLVFADTPDWIDMGQQPSEPIGELSFLRIRKVYDSKHPKSVIPVPRDLMGWITTHPGIKVITAPVPVTIGGVTGTRADIEVVAKGCPDPIANAGCVSLGPPAPDNLGFGFGSGEEIRLIVLNVRGETVVISYGDAPESFEHRFIEAQAVLDTVQFG